MSHSEHSHTSASPLGQSASGMLLVGGPLGIAASFLGLAIFLASCFGFEAALMFGVIPFALGCVGILLTILGTIIRRGNVEETQALAGILINFLAIVGALLEMSAYFRWTIFFKS